VPTTLTIGLDAGQPLDLVVDRLETDGDEAVEALAREEVAEDPFAALACRAWRRTG
jgi:hypothetical protein